MRLVGLRTWIGGLSLDTLMTALTSDWAEMTGHKAIAFGVLWVVQVAIVVRGIEGIVFLESYAAPLLLAGSVAYVVLMRAEIPARSPAGAAVE